MVQSSNFFDYLNKLNVLVVGDVMIDRYLTGKVSRISPEAPVPVVDLQRTEDRLGGAANVALNIKTMGATPYLFSVVGKDENAQILGELLPQAGLSAKGIIHDADRITTVKTRVIAQNQHLLRVDRENTADLRDETAGIFLTAIRDLLDSREIHVILFQDYNKGVLTYTLIRQLILEAVKRDIPTAVDPKFHNFWAYQHVRLFKPNLKEIRSQLDFPVEANLASLQRATQQIRRKLGNPYTLITLSEKGLFIDREGESRVIPTHPRSIADVCGAGDTVISVAALGLALGLSVEEIGVISNLAGGQVCEKVGVVPVDLPQLIREYQEISQTRVS